jgi:PST family polysaccharide transporter
MVLWLFPHVAWCLHGTPISMKDLARTIVRPLISGGVGSACAFELGRTFASDMPPAYRLFLGGVAMTVIYVWMLLVLMGQWKIYMNVLAALRRPSGLGV